MTLMPQPPSSAANTASACGSQPSITAWVREFLTENGVADYQLVDSQGATEGTVKNLTAEAIADITSTGETLKANHLKILSDGLIHQSEATLFRSRSADWGGEATAIYTALVNKLGLEGVK